MNERAHSSRFPVLPIRYFCLLSQFAPLLCEVQVQDFGRTVLDGFRGLFAVSCLLSVTLRSQAHANDYSAGVSRVNWRSLTILTPPALLGLPFHPVRSAIAITRPLRLNQATIFALRSLFRRTCHARRADAQAPAAASSQRAAMSSNISRCSIVLARSAQPMHLRANKRYRSAVGMSLTPSS